jgi:uncharacterized oxidoreductase
MNLSGNTILITGGGSGIGRGLAEGFHALGNQVIIAGRRQAMLDETTQANPGMKSLTFDVGNASEIAPFAARAIEQFPALNVLINNAGIMRSERLAAQPVNLADAETIVATNLLGPIRLTVALLPHLQKQASSAIINVTSGLAFVPLVFTPTYCATKAAIHSYSQSLRYQLKSTSVEVIELVPPYVQTNLMDGADDPRAMPLKEFIQEVMDIFKTQPTPSEILVERVKQLRNAEREGRYDGTFTGLNGGMAGRFEE